MVFGHTCKLYGMQQLLATHKQLIVSYIAIKPGKAAKTNLFSS